MPPATSSSPIVIHISPDSHAGVNALEIIFRSIPLLQAEPTSKCQSHPTLIKDFSSPKSEFLFLSSLFLFPSSSLSFFYLIPFPSAGFGVTELSTQDVGSRLFRVLFFSFPILLNKPSGQRLFIQLSLPSLYFPGKNESQTALRFRGFISSHLLYSSKVSYGCVLHSHM